MVRLGLRVIYYNLDMHPEFDRIENEIENKRKQNEL